MELDAVDRKPAVAHAHHLAFRARGRDLQLVRNRRGRKRVVTAGLELLGEPGEEPHAVVAERARLAVDEPPRRPALATEGLQDRLVAEAAAERRDLASAGELDGPGRPAAWRRRGRRPR